MSYQVLARKWRPAKFSQLVGQQHVKSALINGLNNQRLHHAYLFTGTRGVGKTSIARIFAKSLNCETGVSAEPCGKCVVCQDVDAGRFVDLIEIDAASRTKVGDTREILDNVQYAPTRGRYKIYLIDEVHMLSRHSFNALLKTLEEPPEHVKFLLATTDPQKLPVTILSRCLQFNLQALSKEQIEQQLQGILSSEQIPFGADAVSLLAKYAKGSMRDALSLTDQAIAQSDANLTVDVVQQMLGTVDVAWGVNLLIAIFANDGQKLIELFEGLLKQSPDVNKVLEDMLELCHQVALTQVLPDAAKLSSDNESFVRQVAEQLSPQELQVYYQLLLQGKKDLPLAPDVQSGFEMLCLRLMAFKPSESFSFEYVKKNASVSSDQSSNQTTTQYEPLPSDNDRHQLEEVVAEHQSEKEAVSQEVATDKVTIAETHKENSLSDTDKSLKAELAAVPLSDDVSGLEQANQPTPSETAATSIDEEPILSPPSNLSELSPVNPLPTVQGPVPKEAQPVGEFPEIDEANLLAQQAFYQDMAESQGFSGEPEDMSVGADDYSEFANAQDRNENLSSGLGGVSSQEVLPQKDIYTGTEHDNPVLAILASRGINPEEQPNFALEIENNLEESSNSPAETADETQVDEPLPELKELEHEEVRFAHEVDEWAQLIERSNLAGLGRQLALNGSVEINDNQIILTVKQEFAHLLNEKSEAELIEVVSKLAPEASFSINKSEITQFAPSDIQKNINENRQERAERSIYEDPLVQSLMNEFDGKLVPNSITPL